MPTWNGHIKGKDSGGQQAYGDKHARVVPLYVTSTTDSRRGRLTRGVRYRPEHIR